MSGERKKEGNGECSIATSDDTPNFLTREVARFDAA